MVLLFVIPAGSERYHLPALEEVPRISVSARQALLKYCGGAEMRAGRRQRSKNGPNESGLKFTKRSKRVMVTL